jgi:acetoin utilization protein AcuB
MLVGNRMTPNPIVVSPTLPIAEAIDLMRQNDVHRFPVVDKKGKLVGVVAHEDLMYASPSSITSLNVWEISYLMNQIQVREAMTAEVITVTEDTTLEEAASLMRNKDVGGLPVMRDKKGVGIITESDIFDVFLELLMAKEKGVRLTVLAPYYRGSLARITSAITEKGGLIHALNTFEGTQEDNWGCHMKVADISRDELVELVRPMVNEILDVRET